MLLFPHRWGSVRLHFIPEANIYPTCHHTHLPPSLLDAPAAPWSTGLAGWLHIKADPGSASSEFHFSNATNSSHVQVLPGPLSVPVWQPELTEPEPMSTVQLWGTRSSVSDPAVCVFCLPPWQGVRITCQLATKINLRSFRALDRGFIPIFLIL